MKHIYGIKIDDILVGYAINHFGDQVLILGSDLIWTTSSLDMAKNVAKTPVFNGILNGYYDRNPVVIKLTIQT